MLELNQDRICKDKIAKFWKMIKFNENIYLRVELTPARIGKGNPVSAQVPP